MDMSPAKPDMALSKRYTQLVGRPLKKVYIAGAMRGARKVTLSGRNAHPQIAPATKDRKVSKAKKAANRQLEAIKWLRRIARRNRLDEFFPLKG